MAGLQAQPPRKRSDGENAAPCRRNGANQLEEKVPLRRPTGLHLYPYFFTMLHNMTATCLRQRARPANGPLAVKVRLIKIRTAARADPGYCCTDINVIYLSCYMSARALCMLRPAAALNKKHLQIRFPLRRCRLNAYGASNCSNTLCLRPYADVCLGSRQGIARLKQPNKNSYHLVSHRKMP